LAHAVTSGIISALVWMYFRSAGCAIASFICGVFIDLDHLVDYYSSHKFTLDPKIVYDACSRVTMRRLYLLFHSYELLIALWACILIFSLSDIWKAAAIGFTQHMIFDQIMNPISGYGYFFVYRALHKFDRGRVIHYGKGARA